MSKEALEGPQGPAPTPASEFEDEAKGKKPAAKETKPGKQNILYEPFLLLSLTGSNVVCSRVRVSGQL